MDFIEVCRKLIAIDSTPAQGSLKMAENLAELARARGFHAELQEENMAGVPQANLIVRPREKRPEREFLFQTHLDTPDPGPFGLWRKTGLNPFDATIIDGRIHGLGVADNKLDFLCKLEAMTSCEGANFKVPPVLVGTFGEESGMVGALRLIRKNKISARRALIGEPSNLRLITAGKGFASVEIQVPFEEDERRFRHEHNLSEGTSTQSRLFNGKAAHSSVPHLGESAIKKMLDYLVQLPEDLVIMEVDGGVNFNTVPAQAFIELDPSSGCRMSMASKLGKIYRAILALEDIFAGYRDPRFTPGHPTLSLGLIRTFEDHVVLSGSCRMPPIIATEIYESWMRRLQEVCESVNAVFRVQDYKKPYQTEDSSDFVKGARLELRGMKLFDETTTQPSTNEACLFSRVGIECISFGPGRGEGNIHTPDENVAIEDLRQATEFYRRIMERFCK